MKIDYPVGTKLRLRVERQPVYGGSERHATYRETTKTAVVLETLDDGRVLVKLKAHKLGWQIGTITKLNSGDLELTGSGPCGKRPYRYLILAIEAS